jgi:hypothetical protein
VDPDVGSGSRRERHMCEGIERWVKSASERTTGWEMKEIYDTFTGTRRM